MFARQPKNGRLTAKELRAAYRRRLFEVLGSVDEDRSTTEESHPPFTPAPDVDLKRTPDRLQSAYRYAQ